MRIKERLKSEMPRKNNTSCKSPWRFLFLAMAIYGAAELLDFFLGWLMYRMLTDSRFLPAESVGIIGGADGPTSVFVAGVTTAVPGPTQWILPVLLLGVGICGYLRLKKCRQK